MGLLGPALFDPRRSLPGAHNLGFMFLPNLSRLGDRRLARSSASRTWFVIERTRLGAYLRAATENPTLVQAFGINVPRMITLTYGVRRRAGGVGRACWRRRSIR